MWYEWRERGRREGQSGAEGGHLVDVLLEGLLDEVICQGLRVAETLEGRVHEARVT